MSVFSSSFVLVLTAVLTQSLHTVANPAPRGRSIFSFSCSCFIRLAVGIGIVAARDMPQLPEHEAEEEGSGGISLWEGRVGGDGTGYTGPFEESER